MSLAKTSAAPVVDIHRIVYVSTATRACTDVELEELLSRCRANNARAAITGMLVYHEQSFLHLLEGPAGALNTLFSKLRADTRHHKIVLLLRERIRERSFPDWAMGFARIPLEQAKTLPGMTDFFARRSALQTLTPTRAIHFFMTYKQVSDRAGDGQVTFSGVPEFLDKKG
jgi:hypothetical protein